MASVWQPPRLKLLETRSVRFRSSEPEKHVLALQTTTRRRGDSLPDTLISLKHAGLARWPGPKLIVADGLRRQLHIDDWLVITTGERREGSARTFKRLFDLVKANWPEVDRLTYCQDDISLACNALDYIRQTKIDDDLSLVSWFSEAWPEKGFHPSMEPRLGIFSMDEFFDSQCITMPRRTILYMAEKDFSNWKQLHACDRMLSRGDSGSFAVHIPNLVDHTAGTNSACAHDNLGERRSRSFPGPSFDALCLSGSA